MLTPLLKISEDANRDCIENFPAAKNKSAEKDQRKDAGFILPSKFWSGFVENTWQRRPLVIKQPFARLFAAPTEIFQALVDSSDQFRAGDESFPLGFYFEHASLLAEIGDFLPEASDESVAGYAKRIAAQLQGRQFGLIVEEVQARDATLWQRMREFLRPLYGLTGIPGENAKATIFLGNYERTPFGLHPGESETFQFVIDGRKRLRVWPPEFFRDKEDVSRTIDYERFLDGSITLDGEPGDVIYWPSGYWHIGEAVNENVAVALSVALFMNSQPADDIIKHAARKLEQRLETQNAAPAARVSPQNLLAGAGEMIPEVVKMATRTLMQVGQDREFAQELKLSLLNRITGFGFNNVPPALPPKRLEDEDVIRGDPDYPLTWIEWEDDDIVCSANGHGFSVLAHPKVISLLEHLNGGTPSIVKNLMEDYAGNVDVDGVDFETSPETIRVLLEKLHSLRAIHLIESIDS